MWLPPTLSEGVLLLGSYNQNIFALDAATGEHRWVHSLGDVLDFPLQASGDTFYAFTATGNVYRLSMDDGDLEKAYSSGYAFNSAPLLVNGMVYAGTRDGYIRAFQVPAELAGSAEPAGSAESAGNDL